MLDKHNKDTSVKNKNSTTTIISAARDGRCKGWGHQGTWWRTFISVEVTDLYPVMVIPVGYLAPHRSLRFTSPQLFHQSKGYGILFGNSAIA